MSRHSVRLALRELSEYSAAPRLVTRREHLHCNMVIFG
jgi:hypothetical protein